MVGVDDDIIRPSPYQSFLKAVAPADEGSGLAAANVTLLVTELDRGRRSGCVLIECNVLLGTGCRVSR